MANEPLQYGRYYHIFNRGNNRENLFVEQRNYRYFLQLYTKYIQPVAETFAYCLLPNHFHFAIRTRTEKEQETHFQQQIDAPVRLVQSPKIEPILPSFKLCQPSRAFNNLFIAYARAFNKAMKRTGVLFETPFGRKIVDNESYLTTLVTYIHRNPQKHGLCIDFQEWPWSSYHAILSTSSTRVRRDEVLEWYNGHSQFTAAHRVDIDETLIAPLLLEDWL